jgi:hypothetical protein
VRRSEIRSWIRGNSFSLSGLTGRRSSRSETNYTCTIQLRDPKQHQQIPFPVSLPLWSVCERTFRINDPSFGSRWWKFSLQFSLSPFISFVEKVRVGGHFLHPVDRSSPLWIKDVSRKLKWLSGLCRILLVLRFVKKINNDECLPTYWRANHVDASNAKYHYQLHRPAFVTLMNHMHLMNIQSILCSADVDVILSVFLNKDVVPVHVPVLLFHRTMNLFDMNQRPCSDCSYG